MIKVENNTSQFFQKIYDKLTRSSIHFFIGDSGVCLYYFKNKKLIDSYYCDYENLSHNDNFPEFIKKYKNSDAKIIICSKDINIDHENLTLIDTFGKVNPIEKYCENNFHKDDLYSYRIYQIISENATTWKTVINWIPLNEVIDKCLNFINDNYISLTGVYLYPVIIQDIAKILALKNEINLDDYIYSTVSVNKISGINITINHNDNILYNEIIEYPKEESDEYIQGVIEQSLSDAWIKFKAYIEEANVEKINVFILPNNLKKLIKNTDFQVKNNIFDENIESLESDDTFSDYKIMSYFIQKSHTKAWSRELKIYYLYNQINSILFKPIYLMLIITILYAGNIKLNDFFEQKEISQIYHKYFSVDQSISEISKDYQDINTKQLADLYNLSKELSVTKNIPFDFIKDFLSFANDYIEINTINWENLGKTRNIYNIDFDLLIDQTNKDNRLRLVENIIDSLKDKYNSYEIDLQRISDFKDETKNNNISLRMITIVK